MKNMNFFVLLLIFANNYVVAMEEPVKNHLFVIPGQNGGGGYNTRWTLPKFNYESNNKTDVDYPKSPWQDFGQKNCMAPLQSLMAGMNINPKKLPNKKIIIHATSQGTATAINYVAENPGKVDALVLEAVLASGNSAIHHTVKEMMFPRIANLPLSYYWLPYFAKVAYPSYAPAGKQPIKQLKKLPTDLPVIIIHSESDFQLSYKDALAVYTGLKKLGNNNVYLFPYKARKHFELLEKKDKKEIASLNAILQKHGLVTNDENQNLSTIDLSEYQPTDISSEHYDNLIAKEKKMLIVDFSLKTTLFSCVGYMVYRQFPHYFSSLGNYVMSTLGRK